VCLSAFCLAKMCGKGGTRSDFDRVAVLGGFEPEVKPLPALFVVLRS
jgi:hypothetical protein